MNPIWPLLISCSALVVSALTLWMHYKNNKRTHKRLDSLYAPRIEVKTTEFVAFEELDESPPDSWFLDQYEPLIMGVLSNKDGVFKRRYRLLSELVLVDKETNQRIYGAHPGQTGNDILAEAKRLEIKQPTVSKHYRITFLFENMGQLPIENLLMSVEVFMDGKLMSKYTRDPIALISGRKEWGMDIDLLGPANQPIPDEFKFQFSFTYNVDGKPQPVITKIFKYNPNEAAWHYGI